MNKIPYDKEAEMSVLGGIYLAQENWHTVWKILKDQDFYIREHQILYRVFGMCMMEYQSIDLLLVKEKLLCLGDSQISGNINAWIEKIVDAVHMVPNVDFVKKYAGIVKDRSVRRAMLNVFQRAENALYKYENDISRITDYVQSDILARTPQESHVKNIAESGYDFLTQLEKRQKAGGGLPGIATGFVDIDTMLGGLEDGKLYVIGGRPSMGKTALALNVATEISKNGKTVMLFSLEMGNYEIMKRIMAAETEVKSTRIKMAKVLDDDYLAIATALEKFMPNSLFIDDNGDQSIQRIASTCIGMNTRLSGDGRRIDCVVIDHLQLIGWEGKMVDRRMQIGFISRTAKKLAKKLECPIILLSQLNRAMAGRKDNRPMLSDLRESGDIEQDADAVIFVHREEYYKPTEKNQGKADIIIAKNRDGECGSVELGWDKSITKFKPWEEYSAASKTGAKPLKKPKYYENNDENRYTQEKMEV